MGIIEEKIKKAGLVALDTLPFIFYLEDKPSYIELCDEIFDTLEAGKSQAVTSTITLLEVLVRPFSVGNTELINEYRAFLTNTPNLTVIPLDHFLAERSAQVRAKYKIRTPDAIQIATAVESGAKIFITNDKRLKRLSKEIEVIILNEVIKK